MKTVKSAKTGYILSSAVLIIMGLIMLLKPSFPLNALCRIIGLVLMICGIFKIYGYFCHDLYSLAFQHDLAFGALAVFVGIIVFAKPAFAVSVINFLAGIIILLDGLIKIQTAVEAKDFGLERWKAIALCAAATCVLGVLLVISPFKSAETVIRLIGVCLIADGALNIFIGLYTIKIFDRDNIIEGEYREKR